MTPPSAPVDQSAAFVPGSLGPRLRFVTRPSGRPACGTVVLAHAFAEEMNKSRRMCGLFARRLAAQGWEVVQTDLAGCGDSAGEFRDATWQAWVADLRSELTQAPADRPVWLWCVRGGSLLAADVLAARSDAHLLLWQPVASGAQHLQQFLRLHAGARIVGSGKTSGETTPAQRLRAGQVVEVGGYELAPSLAASLEASAVDLPPAHQGRVVVLELSADATPEPSPAVQRLAERLRQRGAGVSCETLVGPSFWQTQEIEDSEALLERSLAHVLSGPEEAPHG